MDFSIDTIRGCLLGTIIGDALGLPYEALSNTQAKRLLGPPDRHRFLFRRGMMSDDGEHTCLVVQSFCSSGFEVEQFRKSMAWRLRWWLLGVPAGIGGATLRACLKLWLGFGPTRSGVFSAGNGPAMRSAILGVMIDDLPTLREFVLASARMTHTDPKAFHGAMVVALAARCSVLRVDEKHFLELLKSELSNDSADEMTSAIENVIRSVNASEKTVDFSKRFCEGDSVSGYVLKTVPVAIHAWLSFADDFSEAVQSAVRCGGDTDTVAAITGGIVGAKVGSDGIPADWRNGLCEWPRNLAWIDRLAQSAYEVVRERHVVKPPFVSPAVIFRNILFIACVFVHIGGRVLGNVFARGNGDGC